MCWTTHLNTIAPHTHINTILPHNEYTAIYTKLVISHVQRYTIPPSEVQYCNNCNNTTSYSSAPKYHPKPCTICPLCDLLLAIRAISVLFVRPVSGPAGGHHSPHATNYAQLAPNPAFRIFPNMSFLPPWILLPSFLLLVGFLNKVICLVERLIIL